MHIDSVIRGYLAALHPSDETTPIHCACSLEVLWRRRSAQVRRGVSLGTTLAPAAGRRRLHRLHRAT